DCIEHGAKRFVARTSSARAAIGPDNHCGNALTNHGFHAWISLHVAVTVRMDVDEARRDRKTARIDFLVSSRVNFRRNTNNSIAADGHVTDDSIAPTSVEHRSAANHQVVVGTWTH